MSVRTRRRPTLSIISLVASGLVAVLVAGCQASGASPSAATPSVPVAAAPSADATSAPAAEVTPAIVASGAFHAVDGSASGTAQLKHLPDGSFTVVFEDFDTAGTDHTNVVLVSNMDVAATTDVDPSAILDLGALKAATGMQDYAIPAEMSADAMGYHTVVLWDTAMQHALAAAPLAEP